MKVTKLLSVIFILFFLNTASFAESNECPVNSGTYCQTPTAYCCGNEETGYYCAKDVNGCTR